MRELTKIRNSRLFIFEESRHSEALLTKFKLPRKLSQLIFGSILFNPCEGLTLFSFVLYFTQFVTVALLLLSLLPLLSTSCSVGRDR